MVSVKQMSDLVFQTNRFCLIKKNADFKSFMVWVKRMSDLVFEPKSIQSRQFQTLASVTVMPLQYLNPVD